MRCRPWADPKPSRAGYPGELHPGIGARTLLPLIPNYSELGREVTNLGFGMDKRLLKRLGRGSDEIDKLNMRWDLLVRHLLAKLAPAVVDVAVKVAGLGDRGGKPFDRKNPPARLKLQQKGIDEGEEVFGIFRTSVLIPIKQTFSTIIAGALTPGYSRSRFGTSRFGSFGGRFVSAAKGPLPGCRGSAAGRGFPSIRAGCGAAAGQVKTAGPRDGNPAPQRGVIA